MIVGVESNFVLELTFRQEEAVDCTRILTLAEQNAIQLVIPACALFEPYETVVRRAKQRDRVAHELQSELQQLARTDIYAELRKTSETVTRALAESGREQAESLARTIGRIVSVATVIPLDANVLKHSLAVQLVYGLPPQDSVVFASLDRFFWRTWQGSQAVRQQKPQRFRSRYGGRATRRSRLQAPPQILRRTQVH